MKSPRRNTDRKERVPTTEPCCAPIFNLWKEGRNQWKRQTEASEAGGKTIGQSGSHMKNLFQVEQLLSHIIPLETKTKQITRQTRSLISSSVKKIIVSGIFIFQYNNYKTIRSFCINYTTKYWTYIETTQRFNHNIRNSKTVRV